MLLTNNPGALQLRYITGALNRVLEYNIHYDRARDLNGKFCTRVLSRFDMFLLEDADAEPSSDNSGLSVGFRV